MPIIETTKSHFLEQFEQHISDVLTWDEQVSHSAEPTLFAAAKTLVLGERRKTSKTETRLFLCQGTGIVSI